MWKYEKKILVWKIGENDKYTVCNIENFDFYDYTYKKSININKKQEVDWSSLLKVIYFEYINVCSYLCGLITCTNFFFVKDIDTKEESVKLDGAGGNNFQTCCKTPTLEGIYRWIL